MHQIRIVVTVIVAAAVTVAAFAGGVPAPVVALGGVAAIVAIVAVRSSAGEVAYVAVGLFVLTITWNGLRVGNVALASVVMPVTVVAVIAYIARERPNIPLPGWLFATGAGFASAYLIALLFPPDPGTVNLSLIDARANLNLYQPFLEVARRSDLITLAKLELALVCIPVMIATVATTEKRVLRLFDLWTLSAVICAAVGVASFLGLNIEPTESLDGRSAGLTIHANYLALVCILAIPTACIWIAREGRWRLAGWGAVMLLVAGSYATGSRAGTVFAVFALVGSFVAMPRLRRMVGFVAPWAAMAVLALLLFTNVADEVVQQLRLDEDNQSAVGSDTARARATEVAQDQFSARPVAGVGLGGIQDAHNIYLQLLASGGLIALASFVVFNLGLLSSSRHARAGPHPEVAMAAAVSIVSWLAHGVVDSQLADKYLYIVPGLLLALTCISARAPIPQATVRLPGGVAPPAMAHPVGGVSSAS